MVNDNFTGITWQQKATVPLLAHVTIWSKSWASTKVRQMLCLTTNLYQRHHWHGWIIVQTWQWRKISMCSIALIEHLRYHHWLCSSSTKKIKIHFWSSPRESVAKAQPSKLQIPGQKKPSTNHIGFRILLDSAFPTSSSVLLSFLTKRHQHHWSYSWSQMDTSSGSLKGYPAGDRLTK